MVEVTWGVEIGDQFEPEFDELPEDVQDEILAHAQLLEKLALRLAVHGWTRSMDQGTRT